jgi:hypothetical protein
MPNSNNSRQRRKKHKKLYIQFIRNTVLYNEKCTLKEFIKKYTERKRYQLALSYVTATNKAICKSFEIPTEAGCRIKKELESENLLVKSVCKIVCHYSQDLAHVYSCNTEEFDRLNYSNQLSFF